ncbi:2-phosphosulfolactate phosphatase, partial [Streptomyces sp. NPDC007251]|uniref:2-phosphosulfolactate phosphatase n=1 Tax=Streptomyces sp. NPDC007251 TaxID=3154483 RepID=UPI0033F33EB5
MDGTEQVAVVIDVMRAFTTAAWAFHRGADKIVLAADEDEALAIKACHPGWLALKDGVLGLIRFDGHPRSGVQPREDVHHGEHGEEEAS